MDLHIALNFADPLVYTDPVWVCPGSVFKGL